MRPSRDSRTEAAGLSSSRENRASASQWSLPVLWRTRNPGQVRSLVGFSDDIEQSTSYFPWRNVFIEVFAIAGLGPSDAGERVKVELGHDAPLAPLLNSLFSLRMAETPETMRLSAVARAETTRRILLERLARHVAKTPTLLVLEDLHWFDSGSWSLLNGVAEAGLPILLVATTRPLAPKLRRIRVFSRRPACQHLVLPGLSEDQTSAVLARALGATQDRAGRWPRSFRRARREIHSLSVSSPRYCAKREQF